MVPKPKEEMNKSAEAADSDEKETEKPSGEGGEEEQPSLYDRFGRMLKRS